MTTTDHTTEPMDTPPETTVPVPAMVHLGVLDADRAMRFFGALFDWEGERAEWQGHVRHYMVNTTGPRPVLTDERDAPAVRLGFAVPHVGTAVHMVEAGGGNIGETGRIGDDDGWAFADDGQGIDVVVWKPGRSYPHGPATKAAKARIEWIEVFVPDVERAVTFFRSAVGWEPNDCIESSEPRVKLYFTVDDLSAMVGEVRERGGVAGEPYGIGPGTASDCTDDQGTRFSLWQEVGR
ncbi:MAG: uncharacterized protein QOI55_21 [Actinomycetota bacterium]|nr:uncharacterized protein [Actinomycetota bacterium]